jgi:Mrp family chromosome partitioning ATPase
MRLVMIAGVLAISVGIALAYAMEFFDHSVRTPEDTLRRLGLKTAASLPVLQTRRLRKILRREVRRWRQQAGGNVFAPKQLPDHVITWEYFLPDIRQAFDELRGTVLATMNGNLPDSPVIAVTSCQRHEGVSTVAAGLATAFTLAATDDVLLVNANSHHPDRSIIPKGFRPPHLYEIDARNHMLVATPYGAFLSRDEAGRTHLESVLEKNTLDNMLVSVNDLPYRAVILDLPSMREGGTALIHTARADATIIVVESERVKREVLQRACGRIADAGGQVVGIVLNRRKYYIPKWLYARS